MYPQVFGKYILEREIARGGMARVLLATLRGMDGFEKRLVVKQIREELAFDQEFISRFIEEAKTSVALNHPNIVPVYELGVEQGTYYLTMEVVEGVSLSELLKTCAAANGVLSAEEGAYVGVEVCRALEYAHRRMQVVHRDVTPRNVMVDEEGQIRIIDFGIAARAHGSTHAAFGTLGHMPPEQMEGRKARPAADVFAVAVMLLEVWSGKPPFRRKTRDEVDAAMRAPHPKPSDADIRLLPLDEIMGGALSVDPTKRPQQAEELGRALRRFLVGIDVDDVAQRLGGRVRALRAAPVRQAIARPASEVRASKASFGDVATRTFAVRPELKSWVSEHPPPLVPAEEGTRRLPSSAPAKAASVPKIAVATLPMAIQPRPASRVEILASAPPVKRDVDPTTAPVPEAERRHPLPRRGTFLLPIAAGAALLATGVFAGRAMVSRTSVATSRASQGPDVPPREVEQAIAFSAGPAHASTPPDAGAAAPPREPR